MYSMKYSIPLEYWFDWEIKIICLPLLTNIEIQYLSTSIEERASKEVYSPHSCPQPDNPCFQIQSQKSLEMTHINIQSWETTADTDEKPKSEDIVKGPSWGVWRVWGGCFQIKLLILIKWIQHWTKN